MILLPRDAVSACPGEQLEFTCNTSATLLTWTVTIPAFQNGGERKTKIVSYTRQNLLPLNVSGVVFTISRLSTNGTLPLISLLSVTSTANMNGTRVGCFAEGNDDSPMVSVIHVITGRLMMKLYTWFTFRAN